MTDFCIQLQPDRVADHDLAAMINRIEGLASASPLVREFTIIRGDGFVNLMLETVSPTGLWALLSAELFGDDAHTPLRHCSMVMCEGAQGWDDYLLLHHFDQTQALDRI